MTDDSVAPPHGRSDRRSIRLQGYDYTLAGGYFITICTQGRASLFGDVVDGVMRLNAAGRIADVCWRSIPNHSPHAGLDEFVIMPNHVHGILLFARDGNAGEQHSAPLSGGPTPGSLGAVVRSFKAAVTRRVNEMRGTPGAALWQRNYYEHVIRNEVSLNRIRLYITDNPARWACDGENPPAL